MTVGAHSPRWIELESEKAGRHLWIEQVALMEKSYESGGEVHGGQNGQPEQAAEPSTVQKGKKNTATPVRQVDPPRSYSSFTAHEQRGVCRPLLAGAQPGFNTAVGTSRGIDQNTIPRVCMGAERDGRQTVSSPAGAYGGAAEQSHAMRWCRTGKIQGERLDIGITSLEYDGTIIPWSLRL